MRKGDRHDTGLPQEVHAKIRETLGRIAALDEAILYGSRAMGTYRPGSDIDLSLKGDLLEWQDLQRLEVALDDLMLPYRFDLSLYDQIDNPDLIAHIQRVGISFYKRNNTL